MNTLRALLFVLITLSLSACSGSPTTPDDGALDAADWEGPIIQTEVSNTPPPEVPERCELILEDPVSFVVTCGPTVGLISRAALPNLAPSMSQAHITNVQNSLEASGWTVTIGETYELTSDEGTIELTHVEQERQDTRRNVFTGFVSTGPKQFRVFTCVLPDALMGDWPSECTARFVYLRGVVDANRVIGVRMLGEPVAIPEECITSDRGVSCGNNLFHWAEFSREFSESEIKAPERDLAQSVHNAADLNVTCEFLGEPIECSGMRIERKGNLPKFVVYGYPTIDDRTLRLFCEWPIPETESQTLPACDLFMAIDIVE